MDKNLKSIIHGKSNFLDKNMCNFRAPSCQVIV